MNTVVTLWQTDNISAPCVVSCSLVQLTANYYLHTYTYKLQETTMNGITRFNANLSNSLLMHYLICICVDRPLKEYASWNLYWMTVYRLQRLLPMYKIYHTYTQNLIQQLAPKCTYIYIRYTACIWSKRYIKIKQIHKT